MNLKIIFILLLTIFGFWNYTNGQDNIVNIDSPVEIYNALNSMDADPESDSDEVNRLSLILLDKYPNLKINKSSKGGLLARYFLANEAFKDEDYETAWKYYQEMISLFPNDIFKVGIDDLSHGGPGGVYGLLGQIKILEKSAKYKKAILKCYALLENYGDIRTMVFECRSQYSKIAINKILKYLDIINTPMNEKGKEINKLIGVIRDRNERARVMFYLGVKFEENKDYSEARKMFNKIIINYPCNFYYDDAAECGDDTNFTVYSLDASTEIIKLIENDLPRKVKLISNQTHGLLKKIYKEFKKNKTPPLFLLENQYSGVIDFSGFQTQE